MLTNRTPRARYRRCMFKRAIRLMSIRGVDVKLDPSLLVIAALVIWTLSNRFAPDYGSAIAFVMAFTGAVLFFASILVHELAHAFEAVHRGITVQQITLFLFGGVTEMEGHGHRPRDEFAISIVGPWVSLVTGALFGLVATGASALPAGIGGPVGDVAGLLGWLNVALAIFNLIPGAPLDGGRVLRAGLWWVLRNRIRAIKITARIGQLLGASVTVFGVWVLAQTPAGVLGALWYIVIGVFLYLAARAEYRTARLDGLYSSYRVADLLDGAPDRSSIQLAVDERYLPTVRADDDLHALIEAFQRADVVVVRPSGLGSGEGLASASVVLPERYVAQRLAQVRRNRRPLQGLLPARSRP